MICMVKSEQRLPCAFPMNMETVEYIDKPNCLFGGEQCKKYWITKREIFDHESKSGYYRIFFCKKHCVGFTSPYPSQQTVHYLYCAQTSKDFEIIKDSFIDKIKDCMVKKLINNLLITQKRRQEIRLLDYGTGNGRYALIASHCPNVMSYAVDFQAEPPVLLSKNMNNNLRYFSQNEFSADKTTYNIIILRHVIEHLHNPLSTLSDLRQKLSSGGIIYIEVPNFRSASGFVFGNMWPLHYVPRHIWHFTKESLIELTRQAKLDASVHNIEMPLMGSAFALVLRARTYNLFWQIIGILLHPMQLLLGICSNQPTCLFVIARDLNSSRGES